MTALPLLFACANSMDGAFLLSGRGGAGTPWAALLEASVWVAGAVLVNRARLAGGAMGAPGGRRLDAGTVALAGGAVLLAVLSLGAIVLGGGGGECVVRLSVLAAAVLLPPLMFVAFGLVVKSSQRRGGAPPSRALVVTSALALALTLSVARVRLAVPRLCDKDALALHEY
ncbi:MAG: hypothetical protein IT380_19365 [Myxococcales bacterium]|nr:hypothetical protein [Myxococcales bacterium]